jgi:hypothetical protein
MRLIDADEFEDALENTEYDISPAYEPDGYSHKLICEVLEEIPTVDAVPVVRCRDCITFEEIGKHPTNNGGTPFGYCYHWQYEQGMSPNEVDGNDFCSYGERKVDENGRT